VKPRPADRRPPWDTWRDGLDSGAVNVPHPPPPAGILESNQQPFAGPLKDRHPRGCRECGERRLQLTRPDKHTRLRERHASPQFACGRTHVVRHDRRSGNLRCLDPRIRGRRLLIARRHRLRTPRCLPRSDRASLDNGDLTSDGIETNQSPIRILTQLIARVAWRGRFAREIASTQTDADQYSGNGSQDPSAHRDDSRGSRGARERFSHRCTRGGLHTLHGPNPRATASLSETAILLRERYRHPSLWYFSPVRVT